MNIFIEDENGGEGIVGLPGNEPNAVLHTSFSSNRSSTSGEGSRSDSSQPSAEQAFGYRNPTAVQHLVTTQQPHGLVQHNHIQPYPTFNPAQLHTNHPNTGSGIHFGSGRHLGSNQQHIGVPGSFGGSRAGARQTQPAQHQTRYQHQRVLRTLAPRPIAQLQPVSQLQLANEQPENSQSSVQQPLAQPQSALDLQPANQQLSAPQPIGRYQSVFRVDLSKNQPASLPPSAPQPQSELQSVFKLQPAKKAPGSLSKQREGTESTPIPSTTRKRKVAETQQLLDYGLSQSFDSTSPVIPDRLLGGGIIRARPQLPEGNNKRIKVMDKGKGKDIANDEEEIGDMENDKGEESDQESKMPMRTNAPRSFGGPGEEVTEEESAFAEKAQQIMDKDESRIKLDMQLSNLSIEAQPTAGDAAKARNGMSNEEFAQEMKIDLEDLVRNEEKLDAAEKERASISEEALAASGIEVDIDSLVEDDKPKLQLKALVPMDHTFKKTRASQDFFTGLSNYPEILMEVAKYLRPKDLVKVYSISKPFHEIISGFLSHTMQLAAVTQAPESASIFKFKFYGDLCVADPAARPHPHPSKANEVRKVPSPRWLQMVVHRDRSIRDILALMAREGHRMPQDMGLSLKKMWLLMDIATSRQRVQIFHSPFFTDKDIYNMQMFVMKLDMRFNDPFDGPGSDKLRKLMLGQRGLTPLCNLLKRKIGTTEIEVTKMGLRYAYNVKPKYRGLPLLDIPPHEIGIGHLEGWGKGIVHLLRPDELVVMEAVRRRLGLKDHVMGFMIWGYVDPRTGENIKVTEEEMYMSEDDESDEEYEIWNEDWESDSDMADVEDAEDQQDLASPKGE